MFLEIKTYRYRGHSMSDPAKYRTPEELESYKKQDPLLILKARMEEAGHPHRRSSTPHMDAACKAVCDDAVKFAEESPEPELPPCTRTSWHEHHHLPRGPARRHGRGDGP